jgi:hypothetical protein
MMIGGYSDMIDCRCSARLQARASASVDSKYRHGGDE